MRTGEPSRSECLGGSDNQNIRRNMNKHGNNKRIAILVTIPTEHVGIVVINGRPVQPLYKPLIFKSSTPTFRISGAQQAGS